MESAPSSCLVKSSSVSDFAYCPEIPNRILQERSSNLQQDAYNPHERGLLKYEHTPAVPENVHAKESPAYVGSHPLHQSQARLERQTFRWLYQRLWQNEQYRKYREGQSKDSRPSGEQKWPTNNEIIFFQGNKTYNILRVSHWCWHIRRREISPDGQETNNLQKWYAKTAR